MQAAKLLRAVYAERQLEEVLVDFWLNHFNVYARKGPVKFLLPEHERGIRRHALGRFEDLLRATAESPAMLFYLGEAGEAAAAAQDRIARLRSRAVELRGGVVLVRVDRHHLSSAAFNRQSLGWSRLARLGPGQWK